MKLRRQIAWMFVALAIAGCGRSTSTPLSSSAPQRIVSLTLASDELLCELVPLERIVGVTHLADDREISNVAGRYPPSIPRLKDKDAEGIIGLSPDLVCVAPYNSADFLQVLERSGLPAYRNEAVHGLDQIQEGIATFGQRVGEPQRARELVDRMQERRQHLARQVGNAKRRPRVLFWSAGFTAGSGTTIDDVIRAASGQNVAADRGMKGSAEIAPEQVIAADPEYVLVARWSGDEHDRGIENHALLRDLRAVREKRVIVISGRHLLSVSHHVMTGAEHLARRLHPECFASSAPSNRERPP